MGIDVILGIIIFVVVLLMEILPTPIIKRWGHQFGSKLMVAFLAGFIVFILFTGRVPQPAQKIPIIIAALLLIWANLFLDVGSSEESRGDNEEKLGKDEG
jgi:uncharacterized membrane protein YhaH (DUF805 family)